MRRLLNRHHHHTSNENAPSSASSTLSTTISRRLSCVKIVLLSILPWLNQILPSLWILQKEGFGPAFLDAPSLQQPQILVLFPQPNNNQGAKAASSGYFRHSSRVLSLSQKPRILQLQYDHNGDEMRATVRTSLSTTLPQPSRSLTIRLRNSTATAYNNTRSTNRTVTEWSDHIPQNYPRPKSRLCSGQDDCMEPGRGKWQKGNFQTCNLLHEMDIKFLITTTTTTSREDWNNSTTITKIVAKGGKRLVWRVVQYHDNHAVHAANELSVDDHDRNATTTPEIVALKMFKYRRDRKDDFGPMTLEYQRRDALIHEITTSSPYIVNIHGFCGTSALYDFAEGGTLQDNIVQQGPLQGKELLEVAHRIASSVAHVHNFDKTGQPTIAHADIYGPQWVKVRGEYQLTDFNLAKFLVRSKSTNQVLPFRRDVVDNWFAPEVHKQGSTTENIVTEKMDIWGMGNVLYMILLGYTPFPGLNRTRVHELITSGEQIRPEIPINVRNSDDYAHQTLVQTIDLCMNEDPQERPNAREVADFLEASLKMVASYSSLQELHDRPKRFPSVQERVKRYMSSWYVPPCQDDASAHVLYQIIPGDNNTITSAISGNMTNSSSGSDSVLIQPLAENVIVRIDAQLRTDDAMWLQPDMLVVGNNDNYLPHAGYRADIQTTLLPLYERLNGKPLLTQWGDKSSLMVSSLYLGRELEYYDSYVLAIPHLKKCRPAIRTDELEQMTAPTCYNDGRERLRNLTTATTVSATTTLQGTRVTATDPIIWKLDSNRLLGNVRLVENVDKAWKDKTGLGIFRGRLTGHAMYSNRTVLIRENVTEEVYCHFIQRCRFVLRHADSRTVNVGLTDMMQKPLNDTIGNISLVRDKLSMQDMLTYKVLILLEGNDVPSGLGWSLRSNSVVLMPRPTTSSWLLEEMLEPWVHYIPIEDADYFDDVEEKVAWVVQHEEEAQAIAHRATLWMKDLLEHPHAERDNAAIHDAILERYERLFVPSNELLEQYIAQEEEQRQKMMRNESMYYFVA